MYGIVPIFCNKMSPMVQMIGNSIDDVLSFFEKLNITKEHIVNQIQLECPTVEIVTEKTLNAFILDCDTQNSVIFTYYDDNPNADILKKHFYVALPEYIDKCVIYLVINFENSIKKVWDEVLENVV